MALHFNLSYFVALILVNFLQLLVSYDSHENFHSFTIIESDGSSFEREGWVHRFWDTFAAKNLNYFSIPIFALFFCDSYSNIYSGYIEDQVPHIFKANM